MICGVGYYELSCNGKKADDRVLAPLYTQYDKTLLYDTIDLTECLRNGRNAVGVILGNGWYNSNSEDVWNYSYEYA